jgi:hypothetical protein
MALACNQIASLGVSESHLGAEYNILAIERHAA